MLWSYDIMIDTCAICRGIINDICIDCQANQVHCDSDGVRMCSRVFLTVTAKGVGHLGRMHDCVGLLQPRVSLSLHLQMATQAPQLPA